MKFGISITDRDERNVLTVDLPSILEITGEAGLKSSWTLRNVEAAGEEAADELHALSDREESIGGEHLLRLARSVWQIVDGTFIGQCDARGTWIVISAVDSSAYDIMTEDSQLITELQCRYKSVTLLK